MATSRVLIAVLLWLQCPASRTLGSGGHAAHEYHRGTTPVLLRWITGRIASMRRRAVDRVEGESMAAQKAAPAAASSTPAATGAATPVLGIGKGITASVVVALFVALGEINRLSGQVLDDQARPWPFTVLMGPGALGNVDGWTATF